MQTFRCVLSLLKTVAEFPSQLMPGSFRRTLFAVVVCLSVVGVKAQMIDLNHNGISDIWELEYGVSGVSPLADSDGDGFSNLQEALAGTNPFDSNSYPWITNIGATNGSFSATIAATPGKVYNLQSPGSLAGTNWLVETGLVFRAGSSVTLSASAGGGARFFRIAISDTNSDGSSMNDWEKYQLGLVPFD